VANLFVGLFLFCLLLFVAYTLFSVFDMTRQGIEPQSSQLRWLAFNYHLARPR